MLNKFEFFCSVLIGATFTMAASMPEGRAAEGRCILQVAGHTYLNGSCNVEIDADGSFSIGTGDDNTKASKWFAYVNVDSTHPGTASGMWNGKLAESHAGDDLGTLTRRGACWVNSGAKVCAYAQEHPAAGAIIDQQGGAKLELLHVEQPSSATLLDTIRITLADGRHMDDQLLINCKGHLVYDVKAKTETKIDTENGPKSGELIRYKTWAFSCRSETK